MPLLILLGVLPSLTLFPVVRRLLFSPSLFFTLLRFSMISSRVKVCKARPSPFSSSSSSSSSSKAGADSLLDESPNHLFSSSLLASKESDRPTSPTEFERRLRGGVRDFRGPATLFRADKLQLDTPVPTLTLPTVVVPLATDAEEDANLDFHLLTSVVLAILHPAAAATFSFSTTAALNALRDLLLCFDC